jgi:hypothetical protein
MKSLLSRARSNRAPKSSSTQPARPTATKDKSLPKPPAAITMAAVSEPAGARKADIDPNRAINRNRPHDDNRIDASMKVSRVSKDAVENPRTIASNPVPSPQRHAEQTRIAGRATDQRSDVQDQRHDVRTLLEENQALRADNETLRNLIVERSMARDSLRGDQFYSREFRELLADVETWVVKMDKSGGIKELSADKATEIIKRLRETGPRGSSSAEFLHINYTLFQQAYRTPRIRVQLGRHIVAAILFDKVFAPLVLGIPPDWARTLGRLLEIVEETGLEMTAALLIM